MPTYVIEQYELHAAKYRIKAISEAEAITKLLEGEGDPVDQSLEYIETADSYGMPAEDYPKLAAGLKRSGVLESNDIIPSIRSIEVA